MKSLKCVSLFRLASFCVVFGWMLLPAYGAITDNLTIGNAKALALGNAVTADPPGIDSIHFNPAGLLQFKDREYQFKFLTAQFTFATEFGDYDPEVLDCLEQRSCIADFSDPSFQDDVRFSKSKTKTPSLMLPVSGLTEFPIDFLAAPLGGFAYRLPGLPVVMGTSVYVPLGAGYKRADDDPGRYFGKEFSLARITYLSPSIAVEVNEHWSVGLSLGMSWMGAGLDTDLRVPNQLTGLVGVIQEDYCDVEGLVEFVNICGARLGPFTDVANLKLEVEDRFSLSYNIGILWQPRPWFSWGLVYQSEGKNNMKGDFVLDYGEAWEKIFYDLNRSQNGLVGEALELLNLPVGNSLETGTATLKLVSPQHVATGISVLVTPKVKVNFDLKWTDWASWENLTFVFDGDQGDLDFLKVASLVSPSQAQSNSLSLPRYYASVMNWAVGVQYQYNDRLALRMGYEDRPSSIPNDRQDILVQLGDGHFIGAGLEYRLDKDTVVELAAGHLDSGESVSGGASANANSTNVNDIIYNPYFGLDFRNEATANILEIGYRTVF